MAPSGPCPPSRTPTLGAGGFIRPNIHLWGGGVFCFVVSGASQEPQGLPTPHRAAGSTFAQICVGVLLCSVRIFFWPKKSRYPTPSVAKKSPGRGVPTAHPAFQPCGVELRARWSGGHIFSHTPHLLVMCIIYPPGCPPPNVVTVF